MNDAEGRLIQIGDIVEVSGSPINSANAKYVVAQDGTNEMYLGSSLTMYRVAKYNGGYALSNAANNICFFPLCNFSSRFKYSKEEMEKATIKIVVKNNPVVYEVRPKENVFVDPRYISDKDYLDAVIINGDREVVSVSYRIGDADKLTAFFSNLLLKDDQTITIAKYFERGRDTPHWRGIPHILHKKTT